ncbi:hypothetical protein [Nonomuraea sp. H19]|uniref:hypothetical protein n=1 Tax=Nonomuraea sp. H19 TaxID=3452206 RepID=UPI003F88F8E4
MDLEECLGQVHGGDAGVDGGPELGEAFGFVEFVQAGQDEAVFAVVGFLDAQPLVAGAVAVGVASRWKNPPSWVMSGTVLYRPHRLGCSSVRKFAIVEVSRAQTSDSAPIKRFEVKAQPIWVQRTADRKPSGNGRNCCRPAPTEDPYRVFRLQRSPIVIYRLLGLVHRSRSMAVARLSLGGSVAWSCAGVCR